MRHRGRAALLVSLVLLGAGSAAAQPLPPPDTLRSWIVGFKESERGPFELIRWFCHDGRIRPARAGCGGENMGVQHGDWNPQARAMRANGYAVANVLVALTPQRFVGPDADLDAWTQILLERFLVGFDDGWIFRGAYGYRGAFQIEDEEQAARRIMMAMLADRRWRDPGRFFLLRESVRLLPLSLDTASAAEVRARAMQLAARDPGFASLRAKIHSFPDGDDALRVREYAAQGRAGMRGDYESLAEQIERLYAPEGAANAVLALAPIIGHGDVAKQLREKSDEFKAEVNMGRRFAAAAKLLRLLRESFPEIDDPEVALRTLMTSLALEREAYAAGAEALTRLESSTRRSRLWLMAYGAEALYGIGVLGPRELAEVEAAVKSIESRNPTLRQYREVVLYLSRIPEWSGLRLDFRFGRQIQRWAPFEPLVRQYPVDRLRGSPLLFYSGVLDTMVADANERAGVIHEVMGERVGGGFRALNPGLARGVLRAANGDTHMDRLDPKGIYLLPETTPDISPVSGILTRGAGSSVSHVQLLARNLGIPNVLVHEKLVARLRDEAGARAVLAVSPGGAVRLAADGSQWDAVFGVESQGPRDALLQPDMLKIDLATTTPIPLANLRALDAGRVCGPKGANLGELRFHFGRQVPEGFVIPFGAFRRFLDEPIEKGGPSAWTWLGGRYDEIQRAGLQSTRGRKLAEETLARLRRFIAEAPFVSGFETDVEWALREQFGAPGRYGVFVRSDTNVEDLPGFTGAGLNQTVPNVVGNEAILAAIRTVWASPFSERSFAWRQSHMSDPENLFASVVVQRAFPSEKSGVLVTVDVEDGSRKWLTIATNEGVGGAVDGQAAEVLLVNASSGVTRLLAPAATPMKRVLSPRGGIVEERASGTEWVLQPGEVRQLVRLAREVPEKLATMRTATGEPIPADVEFAFADGRLALLQIRPFNESKRAQRSQYLAQLDAEARGRDDEPVWIGGVPGRPDPAAEAAKKQEEERVAAEEAAQKAAERRDRQRRGVR